VLFRSHAGHDASFKLLYDVLAPRVADASSSDSFYRFLQDNTNIPRAVEVDAVEIDLVDDLAATPGPKPNVFVFVIDSLRRDYLGAYDEKVDFTPAIDAFARESIVMENAFTRYGATGLSEPSIWVGGLLLHKQYIEPFYPMNTLEKLLEVEGYQTYLSLDTILTSILRPSTSIVELDEGVLNRDYDTCHSLRDLATKLHDRKDRTRPVFAYTQPQNLHVSQITRQGSSVPEGESYPGFHAPYATRVKDVDRCFGAFIAALKAEGLYDDSIVILTSDHGESLGEEGRWGHAYTMYPEIVRIPLIVHLPPAMRAGLTWDTRAVAFLTDITPSLYYLLGHRPVRTDPILGRPLFVEKGDASVAREPARDEYLLASSYGPVYAILSDRGRSLYIADGVNYRDHLYALEPGKEAEARTVTTRIKAEREQQIREQIGEVNRFYRFGDAANAEAAAPAP
jgi:arylsulfatase A-like enzyme